MMGRIQYIRAKLLSRFSKNRREYMSSYFRKSGISVGTGCNICSDIVTTEPYLISIGNDTTISTDVLFLTHDASVGKIFGKENGSDLLGKIKIGSNCFIGARSVILLGVSLPDNVIVAAGSVVTKSFDKSNIIIGGNPAREISNWDRLREKSENKVYAIHGKKGNEAKRIVEEHIDRLIEK